MPAVSRYLTSNSSLHIDIYVYFRNHNTSDKSGDLYTVAAYAQARPFAALLADKSVGKGPTSTRPYVFCFCAVTYMCAKRRTVRMTVTVPVYVYVSAVYICIFILVPLYNKRICLCCANATSGTWNESVDECRHIVDCDGMRMRWMNQTL